MKFLGRSFREDEYLVPNNFGSPQIRFKVVIVEFERPTEFVEVDFYIVVQSITVGKLYETSIFNIWRILPMCVWCETKY